AAACGDDDDTGGTTTTAGTTTTGDGMDDLRGTTVTILTPETDKELSDFRAAFNAFSAETGITVEIEGTRDAADIITIRDEAGDPPDIFIFPQPGRIPDFVGKGSLQALPDDLLAKVNDNFDAGFIGLGTVDGTVYAIPNKADLKSLVWYSPPVFAANNYSIPTTWDEMVALGDQMVQDGLNAWCVGLGSGTATGWPFTDWMEDVMLRLHGPDVYDQWWKHEIPFNDPRVIETAQFVMDFWSRPGYLQGGQAATAGVVYADAGLPVLDGTCGMHRQANFFFAQWPDGTTLGPEGEVNVFYLPTITDDFGDVTLTAGTLASAFNDRPEVWAVMDFIASTDYAENRAANGGLLFPNVNMDVSAYPTGIEREMATILQTASPQRFDASDLMPGAIGSGEFWTAAVDIVTGADIAATLTRVEEVWQGL
ncbi:MAG: ABC transporter substrate-binding protein, partial [Acidimicrobiia bacterium]|nr:ABC transporter substrate-binding protein [Acidimicrobiia bacterium]